MRGANHLDKEIGRRLRQSRMSHNLTQEGLAKKLDISFQQLQKYESGANRISASRLWSIAQALNIPVTYFYDGLDDTPIFGEGGEGSEGSEGAAADLSDRTLRIAHQLNRMPDGIVKDRLIELIRTLSKK